MRRDRIAGLILTAALLTLAGCASQGPVDSAPRGSADKRGPRAAEPVPRPEPRSTYGNGPVYEVNGKLYNVLDTSSEKSSSAKNFFSLSLVSLLLLPLEVLVSLLFESFSLLSFCAFA